MTRGTTVSNKFVRELLKREMGLSYVKAKKVISQANTAKARVQR